MADPDISVVVCTYNRSDALERCLDALLRQRSQGQFTYEIVIVDNGSTDETPSVVARVAGSDRVPVRLVTEPQAGLAFARNAGVREARGEWILCYDDDLTADIDLLLELVREGRRRQAACVGGRMIVALPEDVREELGPKVLGLLGESDWGPRPVRYRGKRFPADPLVLRHRKVFESVGPFDTTMIRGGQDQELTRRALRAGFSMWYAPRAVAYHAVGAHRLEESYFRWSSLRHGQSFAYMDYRHRGRWGLLFLSLLRAGHACVISLPRYVAALTLRSPGERLWWKSQLWRATGYARTALSLLSPRFCAQRDFFASLEFRTEQGR